MLEGGGLVLDDRASRPGVTPAGRVIGDMVDSTDFFPTFAEIAGAALPAKTVIDGHSLAPQFRGEKGRPRTWAFSNQLARMWYVRETGWKLNEKGELYDMTEAPFVEKLVPAHSKDSSALAARQRLAAVLAQLNPAGGIVDQGDPSGLHVTPSAKPSVKRLVNSALFRPDHP